MTVFPIDEWKGRETPFYYYDLELLRQTVEEIKRSAPEPNWHVHYAVKACVTEPVLKTIIDAGLGTDCVSGGEVRASLEAGAKPEQILFAGVAKADWEIRLALEKEIAALNVASVEELENIERIAGEMNKVAHVCLRINPNVDAHTHKKITTGLNINKFGIQIKDLMPTIEKCMAMPHVAFEGLHFHIGSQITDFAPFRNLCMQVNKLVEQIEAAGIRVKNIDVGGGLGVSYDHPNHFCIPDFEGYFRTFRKFLKLREDQELHFELGRAVVAQCGSLITRVLYVKHTEQKEFVMVDAGMTDLIRPALYDAYHKVENITAKREGRKERMRYDVVGPICESSDVFVENFEMPLTHRGDILALRSAGAYGEIMASQYNLRRLPGHVVSTD